MAKVLVVGGLGYVGSACSHWLQDQGHDVWIIDDLSTGHRSFAPNWHFHHARIGDRSKVLPFLKKHSFDCVMHFAAKCLVGESVQYPDVYFENNVTQTEQLLTMMKESGTRNFIFSSTCAVFGDPKGNAITEDLIKSPINPYGLTKLQAERLLESFAINSKFNCVALRYFNAAGADPKLRVGELHSPETHLIPNVLQAAVSGKSVSIFGNDYSTPDGTCIRDYVHVTALAQAHESAMLKILDGELTGFRSFNLGTRSGVSNLEMVREVERVIQKPVKVEFKPRRPGDPPKLVSKSDLAQKTLGFDTDRFPLSSIINTAYGWLQKSGEKSRAVFLDRDGTINFDPGYLSEANQMEFIPRAGEGLSLLTQAGFKLILVSNQSGVARGLIKPEAIESINLKIDRHFSKYGVFFQELYLCFHHPDDNCECRKPKTRFFEQAAVDFNIDLSQSYMIGDRETDIKAGLKAGCKSSILVRTGDGRKTESNGPLPRDVNVPVVDDLFSAAQWILSQETAKP